MAAELDIPQQLELRLPADMPWDEVAALARRVAAVSRWVLGDLACMTESRWGEARLERLAAEADVGYSALRDYKAVAQAFPAGSADRSAHAWSVYRVLAAQPDRLELVSGEHMTKAQAEELAAARRTSVAQATQPSDQAERHENAAKRHENERPAPKRKPKSDAERARASRQRRKQPDPRPVEDVHLPPLRLRAARRPGPGLQRPWGLLGPSPVITEIPVAVPEAEVERLRASIRAEVGAELRARVAKNWNRLLAERDALAEERDKLAAELERLPGRVKTCEQHGKTALVLICPACQGLEE